MTELANFLKHYGVKGMKWGVSKQAAASEAVRTGVADKKVFSRKEVKALNKQAKSEFEQKKIHAIVSESATKGEKVLVASRLPGDFAVTIMTGKQFVDHMSSGGAMDVNATEIWARKGGGDGSYVENTKMFGSYQDIKRK